MHQSLKRQRTSVEEDAEETDTPMHDSKSIVCFTPPVKITSFYDISTKPSLEFTNANKFESSLDFSSVARNISLSNESKAIFKNSPRVFSSLQPGFSPHLGVHVSSSDEARLQAQTKRSLFTDSSQDLIMDEPRSRSSANCHRCSGLTHTCSSRRSDPTVFCSATRSTDANHFGRWRSRKNNRY